MIPEIIPMLPIQIILLNRIGHLAVEEFYFGPEAVLRFAPRSLTRTGSPANGEFKTKCRNRLKVKIGKLDKGGEK